MSKKWVKLDEAGAVGYPTSPAQEDSLRKSGFVPEGEKPKKEKPAPKAKPKP